MTLLRTPASGRRRRMRSSSARKLSGSPNRRMRRSTPGAACWKLRSKYGTTLSIAHIDSISTRTPSPTRSSARSSTSEDARSLSRS